MLWSGSRWAIVAQQAVTEGNLLVVSRIANFDIPSGTWIVAHDLTTGEERWAVQLPYDFPGTSWRSRVSAIRDGQVYATRSGNTNGDPLYALDPVDGSIIWRSAALIDEGSTESLAFADNGDLIAGGFGRLVRIDMLDGSTVWSVPRSCPSSSGCQAAVFGERVYIFEAGGAGPVITAFDIASGDRLYSSPGIGGGSVQQAGPLVGPDGTVYAPRMQNNPGTDFFTAFDDTGTELVERWAVPLGYVPFGTFGVGPDGSIYMYQTLRDGGETDLTILRLDPATGDVLNTSPTLRTNFPSQPRMAIGADGIIYFTNGGFSLGRFYSFNADLTHRWSLDIANVNVGGPTLGQGGILVVCGIGSNVRAYRTFGRGDVNCDGEINAFDIEPFLVALFEPDIYEQMYPDCDINNADINGDGDINSFDIEPFLELLFNP